MPKRTPSETSMKNTRRAAKSETKGARGNKIEFRKPTSDKWASSSQQSVDQTSPIKNAWDQGPPKFQAKNYKSKTKNVTRKDTASVGQQSMVSNSDRLSSKSKIAGDRAPPGTLAKAEEIKFENSTVDNEPFAGNQTNPTISVGQGNIAKNEWDLTDFYADEKLIALENANKYWPWRTELVPDDVLTQAPFALNQYNYEKLFKLPRIKQSSGIFNLGSDLEWDVVKLLFSQGHLSGASFAATCQEAYDTVCIWISHWDVSRGDFCDCEKIPLHPQAKVSEVVVVSPFRTRDRVEDSYVDQIASLYSLMTAFRNYSEHFVTLHLHRIPFLTIDVLALVVPYMRRLKFLGVYRCELLHLGHVNDLLRIIRTDRGHWMTKNIQLDFYPRFHIGPDPEKAGKGYTGSYAATWDNFDGLDTRVAIWAIIHEAMIQAKCQGVDLVSKGTALRMWLDKSPCWKTEDTIEALELPINDENRIKVATVVRFPDTNGNEIKMREKNKHWNLKLIECVGCPKNRLGAFFDYEEFASKQYLQGPRSQYDLRCLGCKLKEKMSGEKDHYKDLKNNITKAWLNDQKGEIITDDLARVLLEEEFAPAHRMARKMDKLIAANRERTSQVPGIDYWTQKTKTRTQYSPCVSTKEKIRSQWGLIRHRG